MFVWLDFSARMTLSTYQKINWTIKTRALTGQLSIANTPQLIPHRRIHFSVSGVAAAGNPFHRPNGGQDDQEPDNSLVPFRSHRPYAADHPAETKAKMFSNVCKRTQTGHRMFPRPLQIRWKRRVKLRQLIYTRFPLQSRLYQQHLAVGQ